MYMQNMSSYVATYFQDVNSFGLHYIASQFVSHVSFLYVWT